MSRTNLKRYLMLLAVIGLVAIASGGGSGTFASFNAEVANNGNTFASGTLFLHETQSGQVNCNSESDTTNNSFSGTGCNVLFNATSLTNGVQTAHLALNNAGTIPAADTKFNVTSCAFTVNTSGPGGTGSAVTFGSPPACSDMYLTLQETNSSYTTPGYDVYCAFGPSTSTQPDCDPPDNTKTLTTAAEPSFQTLLTTGAGPVTIAPGDTRYYVISILPNPTLGTDNNGNRLQNRKLTFGLTWHIDQA
jgi:predicted ribosomally synthesized peptide with SipW-like signal peptide